MRIHSIMNEIKDANKTTTLQITPFVMSELCNNPPIVMIAKRTSGCRWISRDELDKLDKTDKNI